MKIQLKVLRKARGMTQQEVADALGEKVATYRGWENGYRDISMANACACANLFGCTLDDIAGRTIPHDGRTAQIGECYANMNEQGRDMLTRLARSMERDTANRVERHGKGSGGESAAKTA